MPFHKFWASWLAAMSATDVFASGSAALITGGASRIGLAVARLCRSKGMKMLLVDRNADALKKAKDEISGDGPAGHDVVTSVADVSQPDSWKTVKEAVVKAFGSIELLVLNAGMAAKGSWGDDERFRRLRRTFLESPTASTPSFL